ncbi:unnamed protein product [Caenorhabditis nigoni]
MKRCSQKPERKSCCQIDVLLSGPGFTNCYASCGYHVVTVYPVHHHASSQDYIDAIDFECYAQIFEEIEATIECATVTGFINCSISGMISSTQLYFNQPQFVENCSITRGKIKNSFIVNGTLITEPTFSITGHEGIIRSRSLFDKIQSWIL